jgi:hypothetical protein
MPSFGLRADRLDDPRNRAFPMAGITEPDESLLPNAASWLTSVRPFDQGNTGTCVAHAGEMFLLLPPVVQKRAGSYPNRWDLYRECVRRDEWAENDSQADLPDGDPGMDFGTSTLALMKTFQALGWIGEYRWAWDVPTVSRFLRMQGPNFAGKLGGPVIVGIPWLSSMFDVGGDGILRVDPRSGVAGWHEVVLRGANNSRGMFRLRNSWGTTWGRSGEAYLPFEGMDWMFRVGADAVTTNELRLAR